MGANIDNIRANKVKCNINFETMKTKPISVVEIGDYISMTPTSTSYNCTQNTINPSELNLWRVIKKNEDGTVDVVSEYVSSTQVYFSGQTGYLNYVGALNTIAAQYTNEKYVLKTRHIGYSNQTETITDTSKLNQTTLPWPKFTSLYDQWSECNGYLCGADEVLGAGDIGYETDYDLVNEVCSNMIGYTPNLISSSYWIASRLYYYWNASYWSFGGRIVSSDGYINGSDLLRFDRSFSSLNKQYAVRPILTLKSNLQIIDGDGKSADTAYILG